MSDKVVNEVLRASLMQFYSPLPCLKRAIRRLEEGDADAALDEAACVEDADDIQICEAFILTGFAELLTGSSLFAGSALRDALEYWDDMRVSPKAPLPYSYSDIQMMVTILTDKSLDKDTKLAKASALLPARFRAAVDNGSAVEISPLDALSPALGSESSESPCAGGDEPLPDTGGELEAMSPGQQEDDDRLQAYASGAAKAKYTDDEEDLPLPTRAARLGSQPMRSSVTPESARSADDEDMDSGESQ